MAIAKRSHVRTGLLLLSSLWAFSARAEQGVTPTEISVGTAMGLTGPVASLTVPFTEGIRAQFERVNRAGGVKGRKLKFEVLDDAYDPRKTVEIVKKLNEESHVFAMLGNSCTACNKAALPYVTSSGVPLIFPLTGGEPFRKPVTPNVFTLRASYGQEAEKAVRYAVKTLGLKRIAVIYQDDAFGESGRLGVMHTLGEMGLKPMADASYSRATKDVGPAAETLAKAKPEAIYIQANPGEAIAFIKKVRALGLRPVFLLNSIVGAGPLLKGLGDEADQIYVTEVVPLPTDTSLEIVREYQNDMKQVGKTQFDPFSFEGYIDATVFVRALTNISGELTRANLLASLEKMKNVDFGGVKVSFSLEDHQGLRSPFLIAIDKHKAKAVD